MSKIKQIKIPVNILKEQGIETEFNYKLVRERDGLTKNSKDVRWLEFNENGKGVKAMHTLPEVGFTLIMSPFNQFFTWQTTTVTEILEQSEGYVKFRTSNSVYTLSKTI